ISIIIHRALFVYLASFYFTILFLSLSSFFFFFTATATTEIYTLSLHDALPISRTDRPRGRIAPTAFCTRRPASTGPRGWPGCPRSEEHTSELQSLRHLVCRLLLEKKKKTTIIIPPIPVSRLRAHRHVLPRVRQR